MFLVFGVILLVAWLVGLAAFQVTSWAIHLVLALAVISFLVYLVSGTYRVAQPGVLTRRSRRRFRRAQLVPRMESTRAATGAGTGN
jgi:hypothetical protein